MDIARASHHARATADASSRARRNDPMRVRAPSSDASGGAYGDARRTVACDGSRSGFGVD
jgi:hypothetical protein